MEKEEEVETCTPYLENNASQKYEESWIVVLTGALIFFFIDVEWKGKYIENIK